MSKKKVARKVAQKVERVIKAPSESTFKSIVGDNPSKFVEEAVAEGDARRAAVEVHKARVANMPPPGAPKIVGTSEKELAEQSIAKAQASEYDSLTASLPTKEEEAEILNKKHQQIVDRQVENIDKAQAADTDFLMNGEPIQATGSTTPGTNNTGSVYQATESPKNPLRGNRDTYNQEISDTRQMLSQGTITRAEAKERFTKARAARDQQIRLENLQSEVNEFNYMDKKYDDLFKPPVNEDTPWAQPMKIALGTAVAGGALCAALSSSRGQQNNAQLYGQQPLY